MNDVVKIRGLKSGLQLIIDKNANFEDIKATVLEKLTTGDKFFIRGTTVFVDGTMFNQNQLEQLRRMFHQHGMLFSDKFPTIQPKFTPKPAPIATPAPVHAPAPIYTSAPPTLKVERVKPTLVIDKTLRGGQEVRTESSVLVFGNVNPGAQIIAGGSIDVRGSCLGYVHAGAFGDHSAFIVADKLRPIQIRIADLIARPPDSLEEAERNEQAKKSKRPKGIANLIGRSRDDTAKNDDNKKAERASIKNGYIVFEPILR